MRLYLQNQTQEQEDKLRPLGLYRHNDIITGSGDDVVVIKLYFLLN